MRKRLYTLLFITLTFPVASTFAQNCDPWIVEIYDQLYHRKPTADECNIKHYNNGSWGSKQELKGYIEQYKKFGGIGNINLTFQFTPSEVSGDPWIKDVYQEEYHRTPNAWEYNIYNYNNGSWTSKDNLRSYIKEYQQSVRNAGMTFDLYDLGNGRFVVDLKINGKSTAVNLVEGRGGNVVASGGANVIQSAGAKVVSAGGDNVVSPGGGNVVSPGGGNVVSPGGGNVVSPGGGNVVSPGGGNVVSPGGGNVIAPSGGNLVVNKNALGFQPGSLYSVKSAGSRTIKTSGRGAIIIR